MPLVGKDWTHSGIARLFSATKDGKSLPTEPVVISPDGLFPSLYREVIRRAPHEFKIACLEDIKALFPPDHNPFYAGFGNKDTDELSYRKIGIPKGKIFIINPKGEVAINHRIDVKSYTSLHTLVHDMFPPTELVEEVIELPIKHPELFDSLGIAQPKGVLLYGPPGTGKTLLARDVTHHTNCTFIRVSGSELVQVHLRRLSDGERAFCDGERTRSVYHLHG